MNTQDVANRLIAMCREGSWFQVGFSPRKQSLPIYIVSGFKRYEVLINE